MIEKELVSLVVLAENIYNINKTRVLLSVLNSLKVLIGKHESKSQKRTGVKRTLITVIEYIFIDSQYLHPLIILPAITYRST